MVLNNREIESMMQKRAKELLSAQTVEMVIGWEQGSLWWKAAPVLIREVQEADKLIFNDYCQSNLSKYLLDFRYGEGKIAIFVKGCDARAFNRLLQDKQIQREKVYLIGIPCLGMKDHRIAQSKEKDSGDIPLAKICQDCRYPNPAVYDELIGEPIPQKEQSAYYSDVEKMEAMPSDERYTFWQQEYAKCIRCYACRNVCPACNCRKCIFDQSDSSWNSKDINASENAFYGMTRAIQQDVA